MQHARSHYNGLREERAIVRAAKAVLESLGPATPVRSNDR
jgi:hypothetical protein